MARKQDTYGLPDETLQLIAAFPEVAAAMMQQGGEAQFATPNVRRSDLISALRGIAGPENTGVTRFANDDNGAMTGLRGYRGANNPGMLRMKYVAPELILPGAETSVPPYVPPYVPPFVPVGTGGTGGTGTDGTGDGTGGLVVLDDLINDDVIDDDVLDDDTDDGTGGTGGTGTGGTGTGGTGSAGGTGTSGTGTVGTASTGTTGTGSTGNGDSLRDAITAAVNGSGGSIDNSAAGLNSSSSASNVLGSTLTADQLASLTKPKVPNVTLEVSGNGLSLDDAGSKSQTFDYPEFLTPDELKAYEAWMATQGGGKPIFDETAGTMEF